MFIDIVKYDVTKHEKINFLMSIFNIFAYEKRLNPSTMIKSKILRNSLQSTIKLIELYLIPNSKIDCNKFYY